MASKCKEKRITKAFIILLALVITVSFFVIPAKAEGETSEKEWTLENQIVRATIEFTEQGQIVLSSLFNKEAGVEYLPQDSQNKSNLFDYHYRFLSAEQDGTEPVTESKHISATNGALVFEKATTQPIFMNSKDNGTVQIGETLVITVSNEDLTIDLHFELYHEDAGLRYQAFLTNKDNTKRLQITSGNVLQLDMPDLPRDLHYVYTMKWYSTTDSVDETACKNPSEDIKLILNRYKEGHGFYLAPEVNWKTQMQNSGPSVEVMGKAFAGIDAFIDDLVTVDINEEVFQLVLLPSETFEMIGVNLTVFVGDIIDGKMAVEKHFRSRFRYDTTSTILNTNDWDWSTGRNEEFYRTTAIPKAEEAGMDMIMFDDCWNCHYFDLRDSVAPLPSLFPNSGTSEQELIASMKELTQEIADKGFQFGLWYSMSGGFHNEGNDLADPQVQQDKKEMIQFLIDNYGLNHQMIDLTEFWVNEGQTTSSHPTDNVYRKNVLTRETLNQIVEENPGFGAKYTTEVDIYPSQGDRSNELLHVVNNGWTTSSLEYGEATGLRIYSGLFGHMPLDSLYFNNGKLDDEASMERFYGYLFSRNVKHGANPEKWSQEAIDLLGAFSRWRKSERVAALTQEIKYPVYLGRGWTSNVAEQWNQTGGPFAMLQMSEDKSNALVIATGGEENALPYCKADLRWLPEDTNYLIHDITMDDQGVTKYFFKGCFDASQRREFDINLLENDSSGKAFWLQADNGQEYQLLYADEYVDSYTLQTDKGLFSVKAIGVAGESGKIFVYSKTENNAMELHVTFDTNGKASLTVDEFIGMDNTVPPVEPREIIHYAADLYRHQMTRESGGNALVVNGGVTPGASVHGLNFTSDSTEAGSFIEFDVYFPAAGKYELSVASKINPGRGKGVWYIDDTLVKEWNQGEAFAEHVATFPLESYVIDEPQSKVIRFEFAGGSKRTLNIDRFIISPQVEKEPEDMTVTASSLYSQARIAVSGGSFSHDNGGQTPNISPWVINYSPSAVGDSIEFSIAVDVPGTYDIEVVSKLIANGRGTGDWYIEDVFAGATDQTGATQDTSKTYSLGRYTFPIAGDYTFKLVATDKVDKKLNIDRFHFTPVSGEDEPLGDKEVYLPNLDNISGSQGTEIEIPIVVNGIGENIYRSIESVLEIPDGFTVVDVIDKGTLSGGVLRKGVQENGAYRFAYLDYQNDGTLSVTNPSGPETIASLRLRLDRPMVEGSTAILKMVEFTAKESRDGTGNTSPNDYIPTTFDVTKAKSKLSISTGVPGEATATAKILYQGDGKDLISTDKTAVSVVFTETPATKAITFDSHVFYHSPQRSSQTNQVIYVGIVDSSTTLAELNDIDNYRITDGPSQPLVFGNTNDDSAIDAQDALNILDSWLRQIPTDTDKKILERNVTSDGRIDTSDALAVVDYFVNGRDFYVTVK